MAKLYLIESYYSQNIENKDNTFMHQIIQSLRPMNQHPIAYVCLNHFIPIIGSCISMSTTPPLNISKDLL